MPHENKHWIFFIHLFRSSNTTRRIQSKYFRFSIMRIDKMVLRRIDRQSRMATSCMEHVPLEVSIRRECSSRMGRLVPAMDMTTRCRGWPVHKLVREQQHKQELEQMPEHRQTYPWHWHDILVASPMARHSRAQLHRPHCGIFWSRRRWNLNEMESEYVMN